MTKPTVTKVWISGVIVMVAGLVFGGIFLALMLINGGHWEPVAGTNNSNFVPNQDNYFWTTLSLMITGFSIAAVGGLVQVVAWIGALANTSRLQDRTWFLILLIGGLVGLGTGFVGLAAMVAYLVAGPVDAALATPYPPSAGAFGAAVHARTDGIAVRRGDVGQPIGRRTASYQRVMNPNPMAQRGLQLAWNDEAAAGGRIT